MGFAEAGPQEDQVRRQRTGIRDTEDKWPPGTSLVLRERFLSCSEGRRYVHSLFVAGDMPREGGRHGSEAMDSNWWLAIFSVFAEANARILVR
jgi:hypothetical protein